ncbi:MAG: hypothetical protein N2748_01585, partial [candidate division WOR-3 bacterium]|nr:hypothetical protein [candidate division WOR-3 bacterium]
MNNSTIKINYLEKCYQIVRLLTQRTSIFKLTEKTHNVFGIEEDDFIIKNGLNKNKALENELVKINSKINGIEKEIEDLINAIEPDLNEAPFDKLARQYKLSKDEKYIIIALFFSGTTEAIQYRDGQLSYRELLELLGYRPSHFIDKMQLMSNLIRYKLIDYHQSYHSHSIFDYEFYLTRKTLSQIIDEHNWFFNDDKESDVELIDDTTKSLKKTGILNVREPVMTFDQIVLDEIQRHEIEQAVYQMERGNKLLTEW